MGDIFKEQLVKRESTNKTTLIKAGIIAGAVVLIFVAGAFSSIPFISMLLPFIFLGIIGGAYFLFTMQNIEYEYIYTNGVLDIDKIVNRSRRKRVFSSDIRAIEVMAHIEDKDYEAEFKNLESTLDFSSGKIKPNTYVAKIPYNNKMAKLIIEPDEIIRESIATALTPRKFHKKK